jgi:hypothetical protein
MFSTLQNLEHTIQTAYGDSEDTYGGDMWVISMQGVYQVGGAGPLIWAVVSSPLLDIMCEEEFGTFFKTSLSAQVIRFVGYAWISFKLAKMAAKPGSKSWNRCKLESTCGKALLMRPVAHSWSKKADGG